MLAGARPGQAAPRPGTRPDFSSPAARKQWLVVLVVFVPLLAFFAWSLFKPDGRKKVEVAVEARSEDMPGLISSADPRQMGMTGMAADISELRKQNATLVKELEVVKRDSAAAPSGTISGADAAFAEELRARIERLEGQGVGSATAAPSAGSLRSGSRDSGSRAPDRVDAGALAGDGPRIETIGPSDPPAVATAPVGDRVKEAIKRHASRFLPRGTMISGVLLTGLDAPTGRGAQKEPVPALVRIKDMAILPNRFRADVRECFALLSGFGQLSSERAYLRGEAFSCTRVDGSVIDIPLNVYAVGPDSKAGIRGRLVEKRGAIIGKALLAGFAQGVAQAFSRGGGYGQSSAGAEGVDLSQVGYSGVASGGGGALERVADYYLQQADEMYPVIEISAGIEVTLVVSQSLDLAQQ